MNNSLRKFLPAGVEPLIERVLANEVLHHIIDGSYRTAKIAEANDVPTATISRPRQEVEALTLGEKSLVPLEGSRELLQLQRLLGTLNDHLASLSNRTGVLCAPLDVEALTTTRFATVVRQAQLYARSPDRNRKIIALKMAGANDAELAALQKSAVAVVRHARTVPTHEVFVPGAIRVANEALEATLGRLIAAIAGLTDQAKQVMGIPAFDKTSDPEQIEAFFDRLARTPVTKLRGSGLDVIRDLVRLAANQARTVGKLWQRLARLLERLPPDDVPSLDELRQDAEEGCDSSKRARCAMQRIADKLVRCA